jgi:hypothetical protein
VILRESKPFESVVFHDLCVGTQRLSVDEFVQFLPQSKDAEIKVLVAVSVVEI